MITPRHKLGTLPLRYRVLRLFLAERVQTLLDWGPTQGVPCQIGECDISTDFDPYRNTKIFEADRQAAVKKVAIE